MNKELKLILPVLEIDEHTTEKAVKNCCGDCQGNGSCKKDKSEIDQVLLELDKIEKS